MKPISIQLYSVRDLAAKDFPGVIKQIAAIGYKGIEFAGLHNHKAADIRKVMNDAGIAASSAHCPLPTKENLIELVDTARTLGYKFVISGFGPNEFKTMDTIKESADKFVQGAALLKPHGLQLGYHNHWWEFDKVENAYGYDHFFNLAKGVFSELDVYWCRNFGTVDVPTIVKKYAKNIPLLHIKDGPLVKDQPHTAVGKGKMDMPPIVAAADASVLQWLVVELDSCATDMMQAVKDSYAYLTSTKLAEGSK